MPTVQAGAGYAALEHAYEQAEHQLEAAVRRATDLKLDWTAHRAKLQLAEVQTLLARMHREAPALAEQSVRAAYHAGVNAVDATVGSSTLTAAATGILATGVHEAAMGTLAQALAEPLAAATGTVGRKVNDVFREIGLQHTAAGIATGAPQREVTAAMREEYAARGITGFVDKAGRNWTLSAYTNMVARTVTREAVSQATRNRLTELGMDLVTISEHGETDEVCEEFAGNTYSLNGDTPGYDQLPEDPPFHPNCIHVMTPADVQPEDFKEALQEGTELDEGTGPQ